MNTHCYKKDTVITLHEGLGLCLRAGQLPSTCISANLRTTPVMFVRCVGCGLVSEQNHLLKRQVESWANGTNLMLSKHPEGPCIRDIISLIGVRTRPSCWPFIVEENFCLWCKINGV